MGTLLTPFVVFGVIVLSIHYLIQWVARAPVTTDPWDAEVAEAIENPEILAICHRCLTPQEEGGWFCPECGAAIGPYNNFMPYINIYSQGEVLRVGITEHIRPSYLVIGGYILCSLVAYYVLFAPIYWLFLFRNLRKHREATGLQTGAGS